MYRLAGLGLMPGSGRTARTAAGDATPDLVTIRGGYEIDPITRKGGIPIDRCDLFSLNADGSVTRDRVADTPASLVPPAGYKPAPLNNQILGSLPFGTWGGSHVSDVGLLSAVPWWGWLAAGGAVYLLWPKGGGR